MSSPLGMQLRNGGRRENKLGSKEKASCRALKKGRYELKQLLKEALSLTVGSKFKGKLEKERKAGRRILAIASKHIHRTG